MLYHSATKQRKSIRLKGYDYSQSGFYFITICTKDMDCIFGEIRAGSMFLNEYGAIARNAWLETINIRSNVILHAFIIMPNHMHGIIEIKDRNGELHTPKQQKNGTSHTVGAIVRGYKSSVTKQIKILDHTIEGVWHRNYYEHIIRDDKAYENITNYINNNPKKWNADKFHRTGE